MSEETVGRDPIDLLADEFVRRHRSGEHPTIEQFAEEHAAFADEIRDLFPMIVDIEPQGRTSRKSGLFEEKD